MTDTEHNEPDGDETLDDVETGTEDIRRMIRDEIERALHAIPGEGSVTDIKKDSPDDDEPLSLRAVEASVRRIVEEAMVPLREAQKKTPAAKKPAVRKEPERAPAPAPVVKDTRTRISTFLWGSDD
jgi:hypothetical protein